MDKLFFASVVAREHKDEISKELATRHMLKEAEGYMPQTTRSKRMVRRFAPVVIAISLLVACLIG